MAQPTTYNRVYNFQNYEAANPTLTKPGQYMDAEYNAVKVTLDQVLANLALIQRDDGALANGTVGVDQLASGLSIGFTFRGTWATATNYVAADGVAYSGKLYRATVSHLSSGSNRPDLDSVTWALLVDLSSGIALADGSVTTVKIADLNVTTAKIADVNVTTAKIAAAAVTGAKVTNGAGTGLLPRSYLAGLTLSNNGSDAVNDIDISAGSCRDSTNADDIVVTALTKRLDAAWVVGTNQGGLDTGAIANTTYHLYAIKRVDTGVTDVIFSASASAPTLPANYTLYRRIGSVLREAATIIAFVQNGDRFTRKLPALSYTSGVLGAAAVTVDLSFTPSGVKTLAILRADMLHASADVVVLLSSFDENDNAPGTPSGNFSMINPVAAHNGAGEFFIMTDTSRSIRARSSSASTTINIATVGWVDTRGRDA